MRILRCRRPTVLAAAAVLIAIIAFCDWHFVINVTLGFLYLFPLVLLGTVLEWWQVVLAAVFCTYLSSWLDPFPMDMAVGRDMLIFLTLATTGLLSLAVTKSYRREVDSRARLEKEAVARRAAEEQLQFLIESSPAAILTMGAEGIILLANPAAHRLLMVPGGQLTGRPIERYIPALRSVPPVDDSAKLFRTEMQTRGQRESGDFFAAEVFFSTYSTPAGSRLSALVVDSSEHLREREEASLQQLLAGSRILVAAVSHEVRNVCGAIGMMHENLARNGSLAGNQDFDAMGSLVQTLSKIASLELKQSAGHFEPGSTDLHDVLADLRIVLEPYCEESDIELRWNIPEHLPPVQADRHCLFQVFLNLIKNSQRALEATPEKWIEISAAPRADGVSIRVTDSGPGIAAGRKLFQPLQKGADATGLGLYLSRAFMRSFRGDLRHDPEYPGCSFVLELATPLEYEDMPASFEHAGEHAAHTSLTG